MPFKLSEYKVPELHISVAVAADLAGGLAAAVLFSSVEIDLGAGTAGTVCSSLPEVVLLAHSDDVIHRHACFLVPDLLCLIVVFIN